MKAALKQASCCSPKVLANAMSFAVKGHGLSTLQSVASSKRMNKVTEPETSDPSDEDRISSTDRKVETPVRATDLQRMDAWLKLHCPSRNVPVSGKYITVEQLTPDGQLITLSLRKRVGGNLPMRTVAIGSGPSTSKVQILTPAVVAERQARSTNNRRNGVSVASGVTKYVSPLADKEVLDDFVSRVQARQEINDSLALVCRLHSDKRHVEWYKESGGNTPRKRLGISPVVMDKAANDSNIDSFRGATVNGVPIGTAHASAVKFIKESTVCKQAHEMSSTYKVLRRFKNWKAGHSKAAQLNSTSSWTLMWNTASLYKASAIDNAEGHRYLAWLESCELNNPVIDSNRIKNGLWSGHMCIHHIDEQVELMRRLNDASNYHKGKHASKKKGQRIAVAVCMHTQYLRVQKKHDLYPEQFVGPPALTVAVQEKQATSVPSCNTELPSWIILPTTEEYMKYGEYASPIEVVTPAVSMSDAILNGRLAVEVNGQWVHVNKGVLATTLMPR
jgi:hypothetical protein